MQIVTTTVDQTTFRKPQANPARIGAATKLIEQLAATSSLLVLPAGYLRAEAGATEARVLAVARPVVAAARRAGLAIVVGVDACGGPAPGGRDTAGLVARGALPMWLVAWAPGQPRAVAWRQRSTSSRDASRSDAATAASARTVVVAGRPIEVVLCGEGFSEQIRDAIVARAPAAVVLAAHTAAGARHWQVQRYFATQHCLPALRSVHSHDRTTNAEALRCRAPPEERELDVVDGPPWIAPVAYTVQG